MAIKDKRRQKKLERRNAKRKQRQRTIARQRSRGLGERLMSASSAPILDSLITEDFWEDGLGQAIFSRQLPSGEVAVAAFLIDRYCLGVKDTFGGIRSQAEYRGFLEYCEEDVDYVELPPADLCCLITEVVEYARDLGLEPPSDLRRVMPIFGDLDPSDATEHFELGYNGKPLFVAEPNEDLERCYRILSILEERCGKCGFSYILPGLNGSAVRIGGFPDAARIARII